jgi:hypothetical protein
MARHIPFGHYLDDAGGEGAGSHYNVLYQEPNVSPLVLKGIWIGWASSNLRFLILDPTTNTALLPTPENLNVDGTTRDVTFPAGMKVWFFGLTNGRTHLVAPGDGFPIPKQGKVYHYWDEPSEVDVYGYLEVEDITKNF